MGKEKRTLTLRVVGNHPEDIKEFFEYLEKKYGFLYPSAIMKNVRDEGYRAFLTIPVRRGVDVDIE